MGAQGEYDESTAFLMRFSAGRPAALTRSKSKCSQGKPNPSREGLPPLDNIMEKPEEHEAENKWLLKVCPKGEARTFEEGKENFLVRMMVDFLLKENETAVHQLRCLKCASTAGEAVLRPVISTIKDNHMGRVLRKPTLGQPSLKSPNGRRCYGCGHMGHLRGDPECLAVDEAVWIGAPERFKRKMEEEVPPLFRREMRKDGSNRHVLGNEVKRKVAPK